MGKDYFLSILRKYSKDQQAATIALQGIKKQLESDLRPFCSTVLNEVKISGSFAKGTNTSLTSDFDFLASFSSSTQQTTEEIYSILFEQLKPKYSSIRKQNVSLGLEVNGLKIDLVPARKHSDSSGDHWLYSSKKDVRIQTNIDKHISHVISSGKSNEIKITKIWAKLQGLDFPSFYLELAVIEALKGKIAGDLDLNFQAILKYLSSTFKNARFVDPANTNNIISDLLTDSEKSKIALKAAEGYAAQDWNGVLW